jgi:isocitrate dehydrogenase (NAD+)
MRHTVVLIPGDGIGPEVTSVARRIVEAAGADLQWVERPAGQAAVDAGLESPLPGETLEAIREHGVALKGPCTTPIGGGFASINVALRKTLDLYAAVRPIRNLEGVPSRYSDVDVVVIRENTEGLYSGIENEITEGVVTSLKVATERACRRIARFAFDYALKAGRRKVTVFHKANIMKLTAGLFLRCAREEHERADGRVTYEEQIIDAACMRLVRDPAEFDVIVCENLYGDVISDLCAGLVGGLGVTPGANIGDEQAVFEAVHGTAPDIAGRNVANPLALVMSAVMMLNHLARTRGDDGAAEAATRVREAYNACLMAGEKTSDLGGSLGTSEFCDAVIARLPPGGRTPPSSKEKGRTPPSSKERAVKA